MMTFMGLDVRNEVDYVIVRTWAAALCAAA
jgi:hypothetical protein